MAAALTSRVFAAPTARPAAGPRRVTCMAASPGNWCPGLEKPAYLEGLPGSAPPSSITCFPVTNLCTTVPASSRISIDPSETLYERATAAAVQSLARD